MINEDLKELQQLKAKLNNLKKSNLTAKERNLVDNFYTAVRHLVKVEKAFTDIQGKYARTPSQSKEYPKVLRALNSAQTKYAKASNTVWRLSNRLSPLIERSQGG